MVIEDFQFASDDIDWEDPEMDAAAVGRILMGSCAHWKPENQPGVMVGKTPKQIEIDTLRGAGWEEWDGISWAGKPYWQHFLALTKVLFPRTDIHPDYADAVQLFCKSIAAGLKGINMLGSQNCGKSGGSARIAFVVMTIFPNESAVYFANPFDSAADSTIWGEVEECFDEFEENNPELFPGAVKYALRKIELVPGIPRAGSMELRNVKHVGKFKGTKTVKKGVKGIILVVIDEVNEIQSHAFIRMLSNLTSQEGFFTITSQNFKDPGDMGGQIAAPTSATGGPNQYSALNAEEHRLWRSHGATVTIRFSGMKAPNILSGRKIYGYLFTQSNLNHIVNTYGEDSPEFFSQVLSFPMEGDDARSVLSRSRINGSMHTDTFFTIEGPTTLVAFCDPSFGGGDSAMWGYCEFGPISYLDAAGEKHRCTAILFGKMFALKVSKVLTMSDGLIRRCESVGIATGNMRIGDRMEPEDQVAMQCRELNEQYNIPASRFGYDFSMRPDCVTSMVEMVGKDSVAFDYNTAPIGYQIKSLGANSADCCRNRVDELGFLVSDVFANRRARQGENVAAGITQLSRTRYEIRHKKRILEKKRDYKLRWRNRSPDERDVLMGEVGMCYLNGFRVVTDEEAGVIERRVLMSPRHRGSGAQFKRKIGKRIRF